MESVRILRIENLNGDGMYRGSGPLPKSIRMSEGDNQPGVETDFDEVACRRIWGSCDKYYFGFRSAYQVHSWFSDAELLALHRYKQYCAIVYEVPSHAVLHGRCQIAFELAKASRVKQYSLYDVLHRNYLQFLEERR